VGGEAESVADDAVGLPPGRIVPASFFARPSDQVACELIGKIVWASGVGGGRLSEVEAYLPHDDPACHAARGRTRRNAAMFGPPGHIYLFRSYGIHVLLNLVCEQEGVGSAVLIRSFEPVATPGGGRSSGACGPGRVGQALGVHPGMNGAPLGTVSGLYVIEDDCHPEVLVTTRVGISRGQHLPLRYYMWGSSFVSHPARRIPTEGEDRS